MLKVTLNPEQLVKKMLEDQPQGHALSKNCLSCLGSFTLSCGIHGITIKIFHKYVGLPKHCNTVFFTISCMNVHMC